ncbi:hypothetical protein K461DRAFT_312993 [Myriangium duriaei CBS 260.36]|uniref:Rhodopsin domain-containing protein n=1 Tax=Myriangium duriaei CBS 260.36 TaxID=1168546 RepID=A0A9P4IYJ4_9PEZI|nr:hypothetical protein K461DRAFT_312993 [Myriangium duriaei CBS 260.36]
MRYEPVPSDLVPCAVFIWIVLAVTSVAVVLRAIVRLRITRTFGKDDGVLITSHVLNIIACICWLHTHLTLGNYPPRSPELFAAESTPYFVAFISYSLASATIKIAIGHFFFKITQRPWQKYLVLSLVGAYLLSLMTSCFIVLFRCGVPNPQLILGSENCAINGDIFSSLGTYIAALNSLCDWIFAIMPIHLVHTDQRMNVSSKLAIYLIIFVAVLGSIVSLIRLPYYLHSTFGPAVFERNRLVIFLSVLETALGALALSLSSLQPLLKIKRIEGASKISAGGDGLGPLPTLGAKPSDWYYSAKVFKTKTKNMTMLSLSRLGVLPDITMSGTVVSPEDRDSWMRPAPPPPQVPRIPATKTAIYSRPRIPSIGAVLAMPMPSTESLAPSVAKSTFTVAWKEPV